MSFITIHVVHQYSSIDTAMAQKKSCFILLERSNFHIIDNLSVAVHAFARYMLTSLLVDEIFLLGYMNFYTNFRGLPLKVEMAFSCLKHTNSVLFVIS